MTSYNFISKLNESDIRKSDLLSYIFYGTQISVLKPVYKDLYAADS